jgi:hypothetical protein
MKADKRSPRNMKRSPASETEGISRITVVGFKSISDQQNIDIRPLTILAGANSSGKSSMMQPVLLMKQTLNAPHDPGALWLEGPNVRFTAVDQLLTKCPPTPARDSFSVGLSLTVKDTLTVTFRRQADRGFAVGEMRYVKDGSTTTFRAEMDNEAIRRALPARFKDLEKMVSERSKKQPEWSVKRNRCFLYAALALTEGEKLLETSPSMAYESWLRSVIHLPGLRGNPERSSPRAAVAQAFPGTFETYTASVIAEWQDSKAKNLGELTQALAHLGLTWKVIAEPVKATRVELKVGRLPRPTRGGSRDLVNIADVGFGVSQALPVIVALLVANRGQLVYLEEPEIHLHPSAQVALAEVMAHAARRGVKVVAETHSSLLLLGVQALVAEKKLDPTLVKLHWFTREKGCTQIVSTDLDDSGAFGDWPEDFARVALETERRYLDATIFKSVNKRARLP